MIPRISLEFQKSFAKAPLPRRKLQSSSKTDPKLLKTIAITPKDNELNPLGNNDSIKCFEVQKAPFNPLPVRTKKSAGSLGEPKKYFRHMSVKSERISSPSPTRPSLRREATMCPPITRECEPAPESPAKTYFNERIRWNKRNCGALPLCVVNFNGVLGHYSQSFWAVEGGKLGVAENGMFGFVEGLSAGFKLLSSECYVAIVSWYNRDVTRSLLKALEGFMQDIDAVYIVRHRNLKHRFRHNYSQIFQEFQVSGIRSSAVVIAAIALSREEVCGREASELFYEKSLSGCNKYNAIGMPIGCEHGCESPLTILVPHFAISEQKISFHELAKFVCSAKNNSEQSFECVKADGEVKLPCEHLDIPIIPNRPITSETGGNRYLLFLYCHQRKLRPPVNKRISRRKYM